jgi:adenosine deaminase
MNRFNQSKKAVIDYWAHDGAGAPLLKICGPVDASLVRMIREVVAEDPALVSEIAERGIYLHMCPTSNVLLRVVPSYRAHPLKALLDAGCRITIGSDDPLLFGVSITHEYRNAYQHLGLDADRLAQVTRYAFTAAILHEEERKAALSDLDAAAAAFRNPS